MQRNTILHGDALTVLKQLPDTDKGEISIDTHVLAYLAGAIDSDGCISIKKSTYGIRVAGDRVTAGYSEILSLKQVTPEVPQLLKTCFGGIFHYCNPQTENSKGLYRFECKDRQAASACELLLPYLLIKKNRATLVLELRESKQGKFEQSAYWFEKEFPNWQEMELVTRSEATMMLSYKNNGSVSLAIRNGSLLALPYERGNPSLPRIPKLLIERVLKQRGRDGHANVQAPELVAWRERLYQEVRELNKIGVNGTAIYHRTGFHANKPVM